MGVLDDYRARQILRAEGLDGALLDHARKSNMRTCDAIASAECAGATSSEAAAVHMVFMGELDDRMRARAAVWNQRLRGVLPDECD